MTMSASRKKNLVLAGAVFLVIVGYFVYFRLTHVTTDNAQVEGRFTLLSSRISGSVLKVNVEENVAVKKGQVLAEIDPADFETAFSAAQAQVSSIEARFKEAEVNWRRAQDLFKTQAVSRERFDNAQATFKDLDAKLKAAQAQQEQARLNLAYTKITAPADGTVARKSIEVGQTVMPGQALLGFVDDQIRWVTANLKETQLEKLKIGLPAKIEVDALPGKTFKGEVESVSPSTGAVFSLLPPDNSTGNFTKVVQRVPVRIRFLDLSADDIKLLQIGLSVYVTIRI